MKRSTIEAIGRRRNYNLVCDSYRPDMRLSAKYKRWRRALDAAVLREMTPSERRALSAMMDHRAILLRSRGW